MSQKRQTVHGFTTLTIVDIAFEPSRAHSHQPSPDLHLASQHQQVAATRSTAQPQPKQNRRQRSRRRREARSGLGPSAHKRRTEGGIDGGIDAYDWLIRLMGSVVGKSPPFCQRGNCRGRQNGKIGKVGQKVAKRYQVRAVILPNLYDSLPKPRCVACVFCALAQESVDFSFRFYELKYVIPWLNSHGEFERLKPVYSDSHCYFYH